jgi:ATP-dependent protease ClpP protease subunit
MPARNEDNVFFITEFDDQSEMDLIIPLTTQIHEQLKYRDGRIDIYITSVGGYSHLLEHVVELIENAKANGVVVRTIVPSMAFSAGSMLAVAGSPGERYIGRNAEHLIHYGQIMSIETTPQQVERYTQWKERQFKKNLVHYQKYCDIPDLDKQMLDDSWFVPANKAIRWKMADKYIDKLDLTKP